jgi:hypothetical protein
MILGLGGNAEAFFVGTISICATGNSDDFLAWYQSN